MNDDKKPSEEPDAYLPLPSDHMAHGQKPPAAKNSAADLLRKKVEAAFKREPSAIAEEKVVAAMAGPRSKHQQFIYQLTSSGWPLAKIQAAWHEYYVGLSDVEKHQVWQEFYAAEAQQPSSITPTPAKPLPTTTAPVKPSIADIKAGLLKRVAKRPRRKVSAKRHLQSLLFGLGSGTIVVIILLFSFFNERFIAPLIQPSRNASGTPLISDSSAVSADPEVIIPKINVEIPVVYGVNTIDEAAVDNALEGGVVHYADTALPGQDGNVVIVGHSSNNIFNKGRYKFAFVLLSRLDNGDTFYLQKDGKRYTYQVYQKEIIDPTNVSVLGDASKPATATLITCDPPGTSIHRLVVVGEQISPDPSINVAKVTNNVLATQSRIVPGNAPSLWSRIVGWFRH